jgi:hypothetical protein
MNRDIDTDRPGEQELNVTVYLKSGVSFDILLHAEDSLLEQLILSLQGAETRSGELLNVHVDNETASILFRASDVAALRTTPPVAFESYRIVDEEGQSNFDSGIAEETETIWAVFKDFLSGRRLALMDNGCFTTLPSQKLRLFPEWEPQNNRMADWTSIRSKFLDAINAHHEPLEKKFGCALDLYELHLELGLIYTSLDRSALPRPEFNGRAHRVMDFIYILEASADAYLDIELCNARKGGEEGGVSVRIALEQEDIVFFSSSSHCRVIVSADSAQPPSLNQPQILLRGWLVVPRRCSHTACNDTVDS